MSLEISTNLFILAISMVALLKGADLFLDSSIKIARHFGISELIISLTLVSLATSLPELGVSAIAAFMGKSSVSVSNIIGSGIVNICVIIGLPALFVTTQVHKKVIERDCKALILSYILLVVAFVNGSTNALIGLGFLLTYLVYLYYLYNHNKEEKTAKVDGDHMGKQVLLIAIAILAVYLGAQFSVDAAVNLAQLAGLSEWFIGATILAVGTSLPEVTVAFQAVRKKKVVMGVGTAIGSNIFNILVIIGGVSIFKPLTLPIRGILFDLVVLLFSAVLLTKLMSNGHNIGRSDGYRLLALYSIYLLYLIFVKA